MRNQYRPTVTEENQLLLLTEWIEQLHASNGCSEYVYKKVKNGISICWEDVAERETLFSKPIDELKNYLLEKHEKGDVLYRKLLELIVKEEGIDDDVYDFYYRHAKDPSLFLMEIAQDKYDSILMIESGILPKDAIRFIEPDYAKKAELYIAEMKRVNDVYVELKNWLSTQKHDCIISSAQLQKIEENLAYEINSIRKVLEVENPCEIIQKKLLKSFSESPRSNSPQILGTIDFAKINLEHAPHSTQTAFYKNQEKFYKTLEEWASAIRNPYCRKWISDYLARGRKLPFKRITVMRYMNDIESAKNFLLSQYEKKLENRYLKEREREKRNDKSFERAEKRKFKYFANYKKKHNIQSEEIEDADWMNKESNANTDDGVFYPLGYAGTWAHDEAGYSNNDIDTIFDGDPSAYWNID